jgi:hypothetical protein
MHWFPHGIGILKTAAKKILVYKNRDQYVCSYKILVKMPLCVKMHLYVVWL